MRKKLKNIILACLLFTGLFSGIITAQASGEDPVVGYLTRDNPKTRSVSNASRMPVSCYTYETFWTNSGILYIKDDNTNPDSLGKWRLVYCLEWGKKSPSSDMNFSGWQNKKVAYALYYGCVYWGETCRYAPYSTGDWKLDYTATQAAVWVLSGQFSLDYACSYIIDSCSGPATAEQKSLVVNSCKKIVNDANNENYYKAWNSDGWFDLSLKDKTTFQVTAYQDTWTDTEDGFFRSGGTFHTTFLSYYNYDMRSQITSMDIQVPDGVEIRKNSSSTFSDFNLYIAEDQFYDWQKTGADIPVTVTISIPRQWSAAIYAPSDSSFQQVTFFTYQSKSDSVTFSQTITLHVPKAEPSPRQNLIIHKVIHSDDLWQAHGDPTFLFEISGIDTSGNAHTYHRALTFTANDTEQNIHPDGTISLTTVLSQIPRGTYSLTEQKVSRFTLTDVTAQTDNIQISLEETGRSYAGIIPVMANVLADLTESDGEVTFFNRKITWDQYSHTDITINHIPLNIETG